MKKQFTIPLLIILTGIIMSFSVISDYRVEIKTAEVRQVDGLYIYFCAEPVMEYRYLGSTRVKIVNDYQTSTRLHAATKKAKKEYPNCDAIIFRELALDIFDCVEFGKE